MGKVIASLFVSLDNLMVGENEDMTWVVGNFDPEMGLDMDADVMSSMQAILLGRITYEIMSKYWPGASVVDEGPGVDEMNLTPKIVFSRTIQTAEWGKFANATVLREIVPTEIERLKVQSDKPLVLMGSASIVQQFTRLGLIDEYALWLHPVILGRGKPLFTDINPKQDLKLIKSRVYQNGVMKLILQPEKITG
jgi:dihydrofolate reductase